MIVDYCALLDLVERLRDHVQALGRPDRGEVAGDLADAEAELRVHRELLYGALDAYRGSKVEWLERQLGWKRGVYAALRDLRSLGRARFDRERQMWFSTKTRVIPMDLPLRIRVLIALSETPSMRAAPLAERLGEGSGSIGAVLRHLRFAGCVSASDDRRNMTWAITNLGRLWLEDPERCKPETEPSLEPIEVEILAKQVAATVLRHGAATVKALAKRLGRSSRHVTQACVAARRLGLLERREDQTWAPPSGVLFPITPPPRKRREEAVRRMA